MKYAAIILAALFLSLTMEPIVNMVQWDKDAQCCAHTASSCSTAEMPNLPSDHADDDCDNCNPFITCCGQIGFILPSNVALDLDDDLSREVDLLYRDPVPSQTIHSIWNPPKQG